MKNDTLILGLALVLASTDPLSAGDPQDASVCEALTASGRPGLYLRNGIGELERLNGTVVPYEPQARLFYLGRWTARSESVWTIRSQTVARSAKANEAMLWRPGIVSECSNGRSLETFDRNNRFVSLQRYYHHHDATVRQRRDDDLANKFHMPIRDRNGQCNGRTDSPETVGPLQDSYAFDQVRPDPVLVERATDSTASAKQISAIYSGLSAEIAHVGAGQSICFGFASPLPTRSTFGTQVFGRIGGLFASWERHSQAMEQAQSWAPSATTVVVRELNGNRRERFLVRWNRQ